VLQIHRRGHAMSGMDAAYIHPTDEMRDHLCDYLQGLWETAVAERYALSTRSAVPILNEILLAHEASLKPRRTQRSRGRTATAAPWTRRQPTVRGRHGGRGD
jgi:hypothetical protein